MGVRGACGMCRGERGLSRRRELGRGEWGGVMGSPWSNKGHHLFLSHPQARP